ncbi:hypothetical protein EZV62_004400 [Acer yangbiense]|uniref:HAT C-terminal dimerisation domain-containing protein n=1 Tax=Acer yangbiense TaxID=1000413 RepID=A0A5C7IJZ6_9ROSI|nr:hypothetical protein EZV62_004400 [Acer yangbiense]
MLLVVCTMEERLLAFERGDNSVEMEGFHFRWSDPSDRASIGSIDGAIRTDLESPNLFIVWWMEDDLRWSSDGFCDEELQSQMMDDETLPSNIGVKRGRPKKGPSNVWLLFTKYGDDTRYVKSNLVAIGFDKEECRKTCIRMIIVDELPFSFVEKDGFRDFCRVACPRLLDNDARYGLYFSELDSGKNRVGPPKEDDCDNAKVFVNEMTCDIKELLIELYEFYKGVDNISSSDQVSRSIPLENEGDMGKVNENVDFRLERLKKFKQMKEKKDFVDLKNEVERYLIESDENTDDDSFDLLNWWKVNCSKYKILSRIAKDIFTIPMSTVASESAFSTGGRVLDSFRSSLSPKMVEILICLQNWLRTSNICFHVAPSTGGMEFYEALEKEIGMTTSSDDTVPNGHDHDTEAVEEEMLVVETDHIQVDLVHAFPYFTMSKLK